MNLNTCKECKSNIPTFSPTQVICLDCLTNKVNENNGCSTNL